MPESTVAKDVVADGREAARADRAPLIVLDAVTSFLDSHGIGSGPVSAVPIGDGHSNVTYRLDRGDATVVLRRPPRPPLPPSTHDVLREARILSALNRAGARVPEVLAVCEEPGALGVPFFVMEHIDGSVVAEELPPMLGTAVARADVTDDLIEALVEVHRVDWAAIGLERLARPTGYLERQIRRFSSLWQEVRMRDLPDVERVGAWLAGHMPTTVSTTTLVHGDYRLGNLLVHNKHPEVLAILDWEMATLGDPLADLGYLCASWAEAGEEQNVLTKLSATTRQRGFPSRDALAHRYAAASGRDVDGLAFYEVLALFKSTVFFESSYRRYREGRTDDPYFAELELGVPQLARLALARTARSDP